MSKQIKVSVFTFDELSPAAKDNVRHNQMAHGYHSEDEALESLKKLAEHFGCNLTNYNVDFFNSSHSSATFEVPYSPMEESEIQTALEALGTYNPDTFKGHGDCVLTGVCYDEDVIDGFRKAWHEGERDLEKLLQAGFQTWLNSCQSDCESQFEDEQLSEHCDANDMMFYADGRTFRKSDADEGDDE